MPVSGEGIPEPRGMQLWVDLPKQFKMVDPSYQELGPNQYASFILPSVAFYIDILAGSPKHSLRERTALSRSG